MSAPDLTVPSAEDQKRLNTSWIPICEKLGASLSTFRLRFGPQFDWGSCIFQCGDGWMLVDIVRGNEEARQFCASDDVLLYELAKAASWAMAGWDRENNEPLLSKSLGALYHRIDPLLDSRLQLRQQRRQVQRGQLRLMEKIGSNWARRLASDHRSESES